MGVGLEQFDAEVSEVEQLGSLRLLWLQAPALFQIRSGQFVMARGSDAYDMLARRPLSLHRRRRPDGAIGFLVDGNKPWYAPLANRRRGDKINLIGPLGQGFRRLPMARGLLLIAEGLGIAQLVALAEEGIGDGCKVQLIMAVSDGTSDYPPDRLPSGIELYFVSEENTADRQRRMLDTLEELRSTANQVFLSVSRSSLAGIRELFSRIETHEPVEAFVGERMACGVGACLSCVVPTSVGPAAACVVGPVFSLQSLT